MQNAKKRPRIADRIAMTINEVYVAAHVRQNSTVPNPSVLGKLEKYIAVLRREVHYNKERAITLLKSYDTREYVFTPAGPVKREKLHQFSGMFKYVQIDYVVEPITGKYIYGHTVSIHKGEYNVKPSEIELSHSHRNGVYVENAGKCLETDLFAAGCEPEPDPRHAGKGRGRYGFYKDVPAKHLNDIAQKRAPKRLAH